MVFLKRYMAGLTPGRLVLWCYLIWYLVNCVGYFDADPKLWLTAAGLAIVVGVALTINACAADGWRPDAWQTFRFFLIPFCVSSFAAIVKGRGFVLIFPPSWSENLTTLGLCLLFCLSCYLARRLTKTIES